MAQRRTTFILVASLFSCFLMTGCSQTAQTSGSNDPSNDAALPLFGAFQLGSADPGDKKNYNVFLEINNQGPGELKAQLQIQGDPKEYTCNIDGFTQPASPRQGLVILGEVTRVRLHRIIYRVRWQCGSKSGKEEYYVTPQMLPTNNA